MRKPQKVWTILGLIVLLVAACVPSNAQVTEASIPPTPDLNVIVAQTFAAMTAQAGGQPVPPTVTAISTSNTNAPGSISGTLSYPSEGIPPLRVVAYNLFDQSYRYVDTQQNQGTYQIGDLAPGKYHVVAYVMGGGLAGGYTPAVACGLTVTCTDHSLLEVVVFSGQDTPNINPHDWYAPENAFPPMPQEGVILPTPTLEGSSDLPGNGGLSGKIGYPSSGIPALAIVAFKVGDLNENYSIITVQNQSTYQMSLPPGQYYVVAYTLDGTLAGGYTEAVLCGLTADCTDHSLVAVQVSSMVVLNNEVDLTDWYAPPGTFPANPLP